jgi:tRNA 2-thiocytidine biosynthesis protein TtcA
MLRTVGEYDLIREGDRILVALSGGKDSHTLLDLLHRARRKSPVSFELLAFHLDQGQPGHDTSSLREWLEKADIPHCIHREDTYSLVKEISEDAKSFCSTCSRFRRGVLYTWAERLGCNVIALGHHREDALETLLLNLFFGGRLQAMPAGYRTLDGRYRVIRPLLECAEAMIAEHARLVGYPILPCGLCGSQLGLERERVARILEQLEKEMPEIRRVMMGALKNVRPTHLLDREVAEAWESQADRYPPRK